MLVSDGGRPMRRVYRASLAVAAMWLCTAGLVAAHSTAPADPPHAGYPNSIASTGDSITRAFNTGSFPFTDAPANSWATGDTQSVISHYSRILAAHPAITGHVWNDAVTGAQVGDLLGQVSNVNSQQPDYVTILIGANDACTATEGAMTSVSAFRSRFAAALQSLSSALPNACIFAASVPDIYNLWNVLKDNSSARSTWSSLSICQSMLANPLSTDPIDVSRRDRVRMRVVDFNAQIASVCSEYIHCRFDQNVVHNTVFQASDISTRDYFHPSLSGQARLASATYPASFDFTDATPPVSSADIISSGSDGYTVKFSATDNVGVAGIENRFVAGPYKRYTQPVVVPVGATLTYRSVDVNGNIEGSHTFQFPALH